MTAPTLSNTMKHTCDSLRKGATNQVTDYEQRFSALKNLYEDPLQSLIVTNFSQNQARQTAQQFFGKSAVNFAAVDGTMYSHPLFDMVIFFGGAYAATGSLIFSENTAPKVKYDSKTIQQNMGVSSVVPIYVHEILDVDHSFAATEQPGESRPDKPQTDEEIANNSLIANTIMTFGEYYLALKLATDPSQNPQVILLDRSLSTDRASLLYETRKTSFYYAKSTLIGYLPDGEGTPVDQIDLAMGRQRICNEKLKLPPARSDYLRTAIVSLIESKKTLTANAINKELNVEDEKRRSRVLKALKILTDKQILSEKEGDYSLNPRYAQSWERLRKLTLTLGDKLFSTKDLTDAMSSPMKIIKKGKENWLTTLDIAFLTLFALQMLIEECWRKKILLIGITKDTAARDFKRQLVPIMINEGLLKTSMPISVLQELPNTDRMILQSASVFNPEKLKPPWSLIEYDSAFRTMQPGSQRGYVSGVIRNKISLEKAFLKTYVQLSQAKSDPLLRSNVLLIDRLAYPEFDYKPKSTVSFWNELSDGTKEPMEAFLYNDKAVPNEMQNMVMSMLVAMAPANIPEAFGHNKPLFIADKIAKWNYSQFKCIIDSTANWILNNNKLRKFIFYMSTFRERRNQIEQTRREGT